MKNSVLIMIGVLFVVSLMGCTPEAQTGELDTMNEKQARLYAYERISKAEKELADCQKELEETKAALQKCSGEKESLNERLNDCTEEKFNKLVMPSLEENRKLRAEIEELKKQLGQ